MENKYLEALDRISIHRFDDKYEEWDTDYETVENYLQSIDNSNPSEALECLKNFVENNEKGTYNIRDKKDLDTIKQALQTKSKKELAFDIIKEKNVDITLLKHCEKVDEYNNNYNINLTQEEFELLKEVL